MFCYKYLHKLITQYDIYFKLDLALNFIIYFCFSGCRKVIVSSESCFKQNEPVINFAVYIVFCFSGSVTTKDKN